MKQVQCWKDLYNKVKNHHEQHIYLNILLKDIEEQEKLLKKYKDRNEKINDKLFYIKCI